MSDCILYDSYLNTSRTTQTIIISIIIIYCLQHKQYWHHRPIVHKTKNEKKKLSFVYIDTTNTKYKFEVSAQKLHHCIRGSVVSTMHKEFHQYT